jgi:hypothetical protein
MQESREVQLVSPKTLLNMPVVAVTLTHVSVPLCYALGHKPLWLRDAPHQVIWCGIRAASVLRRKL